MCPKCGHKHEFLSLWVLDKFELRECQLENFDVIAFACRAAPPRLHKKINALDEDTRRLKTVALVGAGQAAWAGW